MKDESTIATVITQATNDFIEDISTLASSSRDRSALGGDVDSFGMEAVEHSAPDEFWDKLLESSSTRAIDHWRQSLVLAELPTLKPSRQ